MEKTGRSSSSSTRKKHHFFKILIGEFENRLRIPKAFIQHFSRESQSIQAILEGPSGCCWNVKLNRATNGMYFEDGWETFLRDHSLKKHDFLVFTYDGDKHFSVRIFDSSACQRKDAFTVKSSQESNFCKGEKRRGQRHLGLKTTKPVTTNKNCLGPHHLFQQFQKMEMNCKYEPRGELPSSSTLVRCKRTAKREVREEVESFTSDFPCFVTELRASNVVKPLNLTIPISFARKHLPEEEMDLLLRNEEGETWVVHCYIRPSQYALCGGWNAFVQDNSLREGDHCIFELVDDLVMNVHIYRC